MRKLTPKQTKLLKSIHVLAAGVWITTGLVMLSFETFMPEKIQTGEHLYMANYILYFIDTKILPPAAITCLLTGLIYSVFTKWGFFKHNWIIFKWIVTIVLILLGTFASEPLIIKMLELSKAEGITALNNSYYELISNGQFILGLVMLSTLIVTVFISVFKPLKKRK
ncbi:putative integral membrane protein [Salinivirga cyanobacteriivorans]|uniref:Putative integral membrane protein n=1 Tax=Salinivirga cyanobacteriivorans TaxID=1307839 RepID=A0A0S2I1C2_9BACT|nr:DUF2269 family protein [Salinivirga cyanobacteriivorans]ALO16095.1 putative integral membrane protein [Salinivirga cyanobacteriivorans]